MSEPSSNDPVGSMAGTWRTTTAVSGPCAGITYTVTPTGSSAANVTFAATCEGVPITATGTGELSGTTLNWSMGGTANVCVFTVMGSSVPSSSSELQVTYNGRVCGVPFSGSEKLHR